jgi:type IV pilus assembly protein PilE
MRVQKGFTLIEVLIAVAVVAILSAIAIPSYTDYIRRARITEGTAALASMRVKFEQFFQDNRTYVGACTVAPAVSVAMLPVDTPNFTFACPVLTATNYAITATGIAATSMAGFTYRMAMQPATGVVMSTPNLPSGWVTRTDCWVLKKDGAC